MIRTKKKPKIHPISKRYLIKTMVGFNYKKSLKRRLNYDSVFIFKNRKVPHGVY